MSQSMDFERVVADWLRLDGSPDVRSEVVDRAVESTRAMRQRRGLAAALVGPAPWPTYGRRIGFGALPPAVRVAVLLALLVASVIGVAVVGSRLVRLIQPPAAHNVVITTGASTPCAQRGQGTSNGFEVRAVDLDTRSARVLAIACNRPLLSPDGTHAAVYEDLEGRSLVGLDLRTGAKSVIADLGDYESEPSVWSPRGAYVYWSGQRGSPGQPQFDFGGFVSRADGGTPARLPLPSPASGVPGDLIWTPDESSVAFNDENGTWWVGNGDGTGFRQLTAVGTHWVAMSPDGRKFAFPFDPRPVIGATVATELGVGDGSSPPAAVTTLADGETAWSATWLPDGSGLAILVTAALADAGSPAATAAVELLDPDDLHVRGRFALPATGSARPLYTMQASPDARYVAVQWDDLKPLSAGQGFTPYLGGLAIVRLSDGLILPSPSQRLAEFTDPNGWTKVSLSDLVFSPDGSRAVLHIYGAFQVIDLDRTGSSRLTFDDVAPLGWSGQLVWTP